MRVWKDPVRLFGLRPSWKEYSRKSSYREELYVGYKYHQAKGIKSLFPFGFGLSYTTFDFSDFTVTPSFGSSAAEFKVDTQVVIHNRGERAGSTTAQLYVTYPSAGLLTPKYQLRGFAKGKDISPGASTTVAISMDKYAFACWDERLNAWKINAGTYELHVGDSSDHLILMQKVEVPKAFTWTGL
jgi:beta-glucosidase